MRLHTRGFTLIEVAIVLIIIGMLTGAVIVGQSLIRSAGIQSVIADEQRFSQALKNFKDKYNALPGDFTGAEAIWGSDTSCPGTPYSAIPHKETCNGNGDGYICMNNGPSGIFSNATENFRAWQQLANAGMIEGSYTGIAGSGGAYDVTLGVNTPAAKLSGSGYYINYQFLPYGASYDWAMIGNVILFGGKIQNAAVRGGILTPSEALLIDSKLDDGVPGTGKILPIISSCVSNACVTSSDASIAQYNVSNPNFACALQTIIE